jgi:hypothetical protein
MAAYRLASPTMVSQVVRLLRGRAGWGVAMAMTCAGAACSSQQVQKDTCTPAGGMCVTSATQCNGPLVSGYVCPVGANDAPADCCFPIRGGVCGAAACPPGGVCSGDSVCTAETDASYPAGCGTITCEGDCTCVDASVCACAPTTLDAGHPDGASAADL